MMPVNVPAASAHEVEGAVRRDEADGAVVLEPRQPYALVELHVLQIHRLVLAGPPLVLEQHLQGIEQIMLRALLAS